MVARALRMPRDMVDRVMVNCFLLVYISACHPVPVSTTSASTVSSGASNGTSICNYGIAEQQLSKAV